MTLHYKLGHTTLNKHQLLKFGLNPKHLSQVQYLIDKHCTTCAVTKMTRSRTGTGTFTKPTRPFQRLGMDIIGPVSTVDDHGNKLRLPSLAGNQYSMTIVDHYTGYTWTELLKLKSEAAQRVINLLESIKTQHNTKVEHLHSDGGGEFINKTLQQYKTLNGMKHTTSTRDTPSLNGKCERMNRTLLTLS